MEGWDSTGGCNSWRRGVGLCLVVGAALHGVLELGNDDRSRAFALGQLVDDLEVACFGKLELLVALFLCSAMMTHVCCVMLSSIA